jgi:hypothetical protein
MKEEDSNRIATLERLITQKYGSETVKNPRSFWDEEKEKQYLEQLKELSKKENKEKEQTEKIKVSGFLVEKNGIRKTTNRTCPICEQYSFKSKDDLFLLKFECCYQCFVKYVEGREDKWEEKKRKLIKKLEKNK